MLEAVSKLLQRCIDMSGRMEYTPARPPEDKRGLGAILKQKVRETIEGSEFPGYQVADTAGGAATQTSVPSADNRIKFGDTETLQATPTDPNRIVWGTDQTAENDPEPIADTTPSEATTSETPNTNGDIAILEGSVSQVLTETTNETALSEFTETLSRITALAEDISTTVEQLEDLINSLRALKESVMQQRDSSGSETDMFLHDRLQAPLYQAETMLTRALEKRKNPPRDTSNLIRF